MRRYKEWFENPEVGEFEHDKRYYESHRKRSTYQLALKWANSFKNCRSILDVGCGSLGFLADVLPSYTIRVGIDTYRPAFMGFNTKEVKFIHDDFLIVDVGVFDVVIAMEVIEHVRPDLRRSFALKLLSTSKQHLIISIPYMWKETTEPHPHSDLNESNVMEWFWDVEPDESQILGNHYIGHFIR